MNVAQNTQQQQQENYRHYFIKHLCCCDDKFPNKLFKRIFTKWKCHNLFCCSWCCCCCCFFFVLFSSFCCQAAEWMCYMKCSLRMNGMNWSVIYHIQVNDMFIECKVNERAGAIKTHCVCEWWGKNEWMEKKWASHQWRWIWAVMPNWAP